MIELNGQIRHIRLSGALSFSKQSEIKIALQEKTVTPTAAEQIIEADDGFDGLGAVTVAGDENFLAENIKYGVNIWGVDGKCVGGDIATLSAANTPFTIYTATGQTIRIDGTDLISEMAVTSVVLIESE